MKRSQTVKTADSKTRLMSTLGENTWTNRCTIIRQYKYTSSYRICPSALDTNRIGRLHTASRRRRHANRRDRLATDRIKHIDQIKKNKNKSTHIHSLIDVGHEGHIIVIIRYNGENHGERRRRPDRRSPTIAPPNVANKPGRQAVRRLFKPLTPYNDGRHEGSPPC